MRLRRPGGIAKSRLPTASPALPAATSNSRPALCALQLGDPHATRRGRVSARRPSRLRAPAPSPRPAEVLPGADERAEHPGSPGCLQSTSVIQSESKSKTKGRLFDPSQRNAGHRQEGNAAWKSGQGREGRGSPVLMRGQGSHLEQQGWHPLGRTPPPGAALWAPPT